MRKIKVRELPGKIRARAEMYMGKNFIEIDVEGDVRLDRAFVWFDTKEKKKFWELVNKRDWKGAYNERPELREEFYIKGMWRSNDIRWEWFIADINYKREKARKSRVIGNGGDFIYCSDGTIYENMEEVEKEVGKVVLSELGEWCEWWEKERSKKEEVFEVVEGAPREEERDREKWKWVIILGGIVVLNAGLGFDLRFTVINLLWI